MTNRVYFYKGIVYPLHQIQNTQFQNLKYDANNKLWHVEFSSTYTNDTKPICFWIAYKINEREIRNTLQKQNKIYFIITKCGKQ